MYKIGFDLGTNSVGWCVTDNENHIVKKKGKKLRGVLMFDKQEPSKKRRFARGQRRRIKRKQERVNYLEDIFKEEFSNPNNDCYDPTFFYRLNNSFLLLGDEYKGFKRNDKYTLFIDKKFNDKTFYKKWRTIYHLEKDLMEKDEKFDLRLIYLAIANCMKHRGNFLNESKPESFKTELNNEVIIKELNKALELLSSYKSFNLIEPIILDEEKVCNILLNNFKKTKSFKKKEYLKIFKNQNKKLCELISSILSGSDVNLYVIDDIKIESVDDKLNFTLEKDFEDSLNDILTNSINNENLVEALKSLSTIYSMLYIASVFSDKNINSLPDLMIKRYDNFYEDLRELKRLIKNNYKDDYGNLNIKLYKHIFTDVLPTPNKDDKKKGNNCNFVRYNGTFRSNNEKLEVFNKKENIYGGKCNRKEFVTFLKKELNVSDKDADGYKKEIYDLISKEDFLLKQRDGTNTYLPYQLNYKVVESIINNQSRYYDILKENKEKILSILSFKIPYYAGPLIEENKNQYSWLIKKEQFINEPIRPWNFDIVVDKEKTSERFISRMQNRCTYLNNEFCLPKDSITFQKFRLYEFLNSVFINGEFYFDSHKKDEIIKGYFLKKENRKPDIKTFKEYIAKNLLFKDDFSLETSNGKELDEIPALSTLNDFYNKVFEKDISRIDKNILLIEEIILSCVIFKNEKNILEDKLKKYNLDDKQIKEIKRFNYDKFSSLSYKFLNGIYVEDSNENGEIQDMSILSLLYCCNQFNFNKQSNLMRIIGSKESKFDEIIKKENGSISYKNNNEYIDDLYIPSFAKRTIHQASKVLDELKDALKINNFDNVKFYVETTRSDGEKGKVTNSRYESLDKIYKNISDSKNKEQMTDIINNVNEIKLELGKHKESVRDLQRDKLFLYFLQCGKDIYTGQPITNLDECDIDHIIPQSKIENDSILDNKVLTNKAFNQKTKGDKYPIFNDNTIQIWADNGGRDKAKEFYNFLLKNNLMTKAKFNSLTRTIDLSDDELEGFTNKQKVSTDQSVKGFMNLLIDRYNVKNNNLIYAKAGNVSYFRQTNEIYKSRDINNYHHAHDAYLNIIIGTIINEYYKKISFMYLKEKSKYYNLADYCKDNKKTLNPKKVIDNYFDFKLNQNHKIELDEIYNNIYLTKKIFTKQVPIIESTDYFKDKGLISIKEKPGNHPSKKEGLEYEKYGGYNAYNFKFFALVYAEEKKKKYFKVIPCPTYIPIDRNTCKIKNESLFNKYLNEQMKKIEKWRFITILKKYSCLKEKGKIYEIRGKNGNSDIYYSNDIEKSFLLYNDVQENIRIARNIKFIEKIINITSNVKINNNGKDELLNKFKKEFSQNNEENIFCLNTSLINNHIFMTQDKLYLLKKINKESLENQDITNENIQGLITAEETFELFSYLIKIYNSNCFNFKKISNFIKEIDDFKIFNLLNLYYQIKLIFGLINLFKVGVSQSVDIKYDFIKSTIGRCVRSIEFDYDTKLIIKDNIGLKIKEIKLSEF